MSRAAVFLDRDGTLIHDYHFIGDPKNVELLPGAGAAVRRLNDAGWLVLIVTNQSGIARGYFTVADYDAVQARTVALLAQDGGRVDASYMCPQAPDYAGPDPCRKPGVALYRRAAKDHDIDVTRSWYVGDKLRDVQPAAPLGGRGILIPNEETPETEIQTAHRQFEVARTLDEAVARIIESAP